MPKKSSTKTKKTTRATGRSTKSKSKAKVVANNPSVWSRLFGSNRRAAVFIFVAAFAVIGIATLWLSYASTAAGPIVGIAGKCLDNRGNMLQKRNPIQLYTCNGSPAQKWTLVKADNSNITTIHLTNDYCLDVKYSGKTARTPVWLWSCNGTVAQQWVVNADGTVVNPNSGMCLDDKYSGTANGNTIWIWPCNGTAAQKWSVPKVTTGTGGSNTGGGGTTTPPPSSGGGTGGTGGTGGSGGGGSQVGMCSLSGGSLVKPAAFAKPTAANTGVPAGTNLSTTPPAGVTVSGSSWKVTANGTVIDSKDIQNKWLDVEADNVTVKNSRIKAPDGGGSAIARGNNDNVPNLTVLNSEVYTSGGAYNGILAGGNSKICGVNAHNFENIVSVEGNNIVAQSNYFHINQAQPGKSDPHNDGMEVRSGSNIQVLGNNITQTNPNGTWQHNTSALYVGATWGDINNVTIDGNWFGGGTYSLYNVTVKVGGMSTQKPHCNGTYGTNAVLCTVDVTNNKWYRGSYAYGPYATDDNSPWKARTWQNNTFEDNGQAISR